MKRLTKAEEQVMHILWRLDRAFVREMIAEMPEPKPAYNTVSTIVRILEGKGFVRHEKLGNSYRYYPAVAKKDYSKFTLDSLLANYFGGSFDRLVSFFVQENNLSLHEVEDLVKLVQQDLDASGDRDD